MTADERLKRYAMLGIVNYVEVQIAIWKAGHDGIAPGAILMGELEWGIMGAEGADDWSIAGVKVVPDSTSEAGVELMP